MTHDMSKAVNEFECLQVVYTRGALLWQQLTSPGQVKSTGRLSYKSKRKVFDITMYVAYSAYYLYSVCMKHTMMLESYTMLDSAL